MAEKVLLLGAGRMGGGLLKGWAATEAIDPAHILIREPNPGPDAMSAMAQGARLNPPDDEISAETAVVILAVKPQIWRDVVAGLPKLASGAHVISIAAGVKSADVSAAFGGLPCARVMPTTGVAIAKGVASIYAADPTGRLLAHTFFDPVAATVDLADEGLMDAATAVSGSGPAYLYAFIEALEAAAAAQGFAPEAARVLARKTITSAAALLEAGGEDPAELRRQVTSPGGTTEAALKVLMGEAGFTRLMDEAVSAAVRRARELG